MVFVDHLVDLFQFETLELARFGKLYLCFHFDAFLGDHVDHFLAGLSVCKKTSFDGNVAEDELKEAELDLLGWLANDD